MKNNIESNILIIDDDEGVVQAMSTFIEKMGHKMEYAFTIKDGLDKIYSSGFDIILLDVNLPDGSGLSIIDEVLALPVSPQIIIMTGFSDPDGAQLAIESGAWDYIEKPASLKKLKLQISRALEFQKQKKRSAIPLVLKLNNIIGRSRAITQCLEKASQFATSEANVLITGKTGTGKELFARVIHDNSMRKNNNFIVVDCSILTENFIESVLFGHEKGAFTGADKKRNGLVSLANNGTLFLDEIGELPESIQSSFLRVLQEKKFRSVGGEKEIHSNFRVIAATNRDLDQMVFENKFRSDLLYRLKTLTMEIPALENRKEDIQEIASFHNEHLCAQYRMDTKELSSGFMEMLESYHWPGNVRELVNTMEICISQAPVEKKIFAYHLSPKIRAQITRSSLKNNQQGSLTQTKNMAEENYLLPFKKFLETTEKRYLESLYTHTSGDIQQLSRISGISRASLYRKLKNHGIK